MIKILVFIEISVVRCYSYINIYRKILMKILTKNIEKETKKMKETIYIHTHIWIYLIWMYSMIKKKTMMIYVWSFKFYL